MYIHTYDAIYNGNSKEWFNNLDVLWLIILSIINFTVVSKLVCIYCFCPKYKKI